MVNLTIKIILAILLLTSLFGLVVVFKGVLKPTTQTPHISDNIITSNPFFETEDFSSWEGNYYNDNSRVPPGSNHLGIVVIHPIDVNTYRYISQEISLDSGSSYVLKASVGNIAGLTDYAGPCGEAADVIIRIKILDKSTGNEETLFDGIVKPEDTWLELSYDISRYAGKTIEFKAEGIAGGPGGDWCGEWAALDYFYVEKIS